MINDPNLPEETRQEIIRAAILETGCLVIGVIGYLLTSHWIWIVIGLVAGLGFSLPAIIKLIRTRGENDHAPR